MCIIAWIRDQGHGGCGPSLETRFPKPSGLVKTRAISMSKAASLFKWPFVTRLLGLGQVRALQVVSAGQSGEARIFLIQDDNLTAEVPLRRSILQSTLRQKYRSTGRHNPQRDGGPEKGLYRLHPIALVITEDADLLDLT